MASITVMIAGSPSGIAEAVRATAIMNISPGGWPRQSVPSTKVPATISRMTAASQRPKRSICRSKGVDMACTWVSIRLIRPSSVSAPVATTRPLAWPYTTRVPDQAMPLRSPSGASGSTASVVFSMGSDSPVSAASSTRRLRTSSRRRSAGTLSPEASSTISPGTSSPASTSTRLPSRRTVARADSSLRMLSSADAALPSWMKPITALTSTAAKITAVSTQWPSMAVTTEANSMM